MAKRHNLGKYYPEIIPWDTAVARRHSLTACLPVPGTIELLFGADWEAPVEFDGTNWRLLSVIYYWWERKTIHEFEDDRDGGVRLFARNREVPRSKNAGPASRQFLEATASLKKSNAELETKRAEIEQITRSLPELAEAVIEGQRHGLAQYASNPKRLQAISLLDELLEAGAIDEARHAALELEFFEASSQRPSVVPAPANPFPNNPFAGLKDLMN